MVVGRRDQLQLGEDRGDVCLDRLGRHEQAVRDGLVRPPFGHQCEHLALTLGELGQAASGLRLVDKARDDARVHDRAAAGDSTDPVGEVLEVDEPVLEQVPDTARALAEEAERERGLDMVREHEDADVAAHPLAYLGSRPQSLVGEVGRHPDVHDRDVGTRLLDDGEELRGVRRLPDDLEARIREQASGPFPDEEGVVTDHDAERVGRLRPDHRRGIVACRRDDGQPRCGPWTVRCPGCGLRNALHAAWEDAGVSTPAVPPRAPASVASAWTDPRLPLLLVAPAVLLGMLAELCLVNAGVGADGIITDAASGYAFVFAGLVAWHRRPVSRAGPLMFGIGIAWFGGDFLFAPIPLVGPLSFGAQALARILFAWLLLGFPSGRLDPGVHRLAVGAIAIMAVALACLQLLVVDPAAICPCPPSPFAVLATSPVADQLAGASAAVGITMTMILVPLVVRRMVVASGPLRRTLIPVLVGGVFSLLSVLPDVLARLGDTGVEPFGWLPIVWVGLPLGFLVALLRERMARGAVADLVIRLGSTPQPEHFRDALAHALGDPSLELLAWSAEDAMFVAPDGTRTSLPAATPERAVSILEADRGTIGAIVHDPHLLDDPGLVASVVAATRLAVENEQLHAEVEAQLAEVQASRARIVSAGDAERRRLERDLHDGAQQRLVALSLALRRTRTKVGEGTDPDVAESLDEAGAMVRAALDELRELARGIHPAVLTEAGLGGAISALAATAAVEVEVTALPSRRLAPEIEAAGYFFVSEALANVAKHAPNARAVVRAEIDGRRLALQVADDGPGGATTATGSGLVGLVDRIEAAGGQLAIDSPAGGGTCLSAWLPATKSFAVGNVGRPKTTRRPRAE